MYCPYYCPVFCLNFFGLRLKVKRCEFLREQKLVDYENVLVFPILLKISADLITSLLFGQRFSSLYLELLLNILLNFPYTGFCINDCNDILI